MWISPQSHLDRQKHRDTHDVLKMILKLVKEDVELWKESFYCILTFHQKMRMLPCQVNYIILDGVHENNFLLGKYIMSFSLPHFFFHSLTKKQGHILKTFRDMFYFLYLQRFTDLVSLDKIMKMKKRFLRQISKLF